MRRLIRSFSLFGVCLYLTACAKIGYVPLSDVSVNLDMQKQHAESKKMMEKNIRPVNSRLPSDEKLRNIKKRVPNSVKKRYKQPRKKNSIE